MLHCELVGQPKTYLLVMSRSENQINVIKSYDFMLHENLLEYTLYKSTFVQIPVT